MNGTDVFIAVLCAVMFFGGLYLNIVSRKLSAQYIESRRIDSPVRDNQQSSKK